MEAKKVRRRKPLSEMLAWELDSEFKRKRIVNVELRNKAIALDLGLARNDLIQKALVLKQLSFLLKALQQQILTIPNSYARRLVRKTDDREIHSILTEMTNRLLTVLQDLPNKATNPNWINDEELLDEGDNIRK